LAIQDTHTRNSRHGAWRSALPIVALALAATTLGGCKLFGGGDGEPRTPTVGKRIPILSRIESGAEVDESMASIPVALPPARVNEAWGQGGGNAGNGIGHLALASAPSKLWTARVKGSDQRHRLAAPPVVGGGKLFVMDTGGTVTAFDATSGGKVWSKAFSVKGDGAEAVFGGGVSFDADKVYVTTGLGEVAALNASDGSQIWTRKPAGPLRGSPTVAFNSVYVMTQDNQIHAVNAADGVPLWSQSASIKQAGVFGVGAPAAGQGTVIAGYSSGELIAYRYENGRELWSDALARTSISTEVGSITDVDADPIIDSGRVYALGQGGRMAAYELVTGQRVWELNLAGISTPAIAGEWIFTLDDAAQVLAIARSSGRVRWLTQLERYENPKKRKNEIFWVGPVLAGGRLWIANSEGAVESIDPATGTRTPFAELKEAVSLPPVVANQTLYILDDSGTITAWR
jgi:outer membrane protein assembly factor BamB